MNNIKEVLKTLSSEFGPDFHLTTNVHRTEKEYIRAFIFHTLNGQSKKYINYDVLLVKRGSELCWRLKWMPNLVIEVFRELKIKRILVPPETTPRSYTIKQILGAFVQEGYDVGWDVDEKKFIMTLSSQK